MGRSGVWLFIAGLLAVASAGTSVLFYDRAQRVEAQRAKDAERIEQLEAQLRLAQAEVSEYREKLEDAGRIARELEAERDARERLAVERASQIEALEREIEALNEPAPPDEPVVAGLIGDGRAGDTKPAVEAETLLAEDVESGSAEGTPVVSDADTSAETVASEEAATAGAEPGDSGSDLERELAELRAEKRELEREHAALLGKEAGGVPIGEVKVSTGLKLKGKVLVVNDRYDFVVVDVGARDGVEKGMVLIVHRGNQFIGKCQVEKVYTDKAAADLVLDWMKDDILVGDGVRKF
jgi:hypothetical protein